MKRLLAVLFVLTLTSLLYPNGVGIVDGTNQVYLRLVNSNVNVQVENQVAIIKTTQTFRNETGSYQFFKYAFPLPEEASATSLRWFIYGEWHSATIAAALQDTTIPGGGPPHPNLVNFLGNAPLFFGIEDSLMADSTVIFELTYVQLLEYYG